MNCEVISVVYGCVAVVLGFFDEYL